MKFIKLQSITALAPEQTGSDIIDAKIKMELAKITSFRCAIG